MLRIHSWRVAAAAAVDRPTRRVERLLFSVCRLKKLETLGFWGSESGGLQLVARGLSKRS